MLSAFTRASNDAGRCQSVPSWDSSTPSRSNSLARPESRRWALLSPAPCEALAGALRLVPLSHVPQVRPYRRAGYGFRGCLKSAQPRSLRSASECAGRVPNRLQGQFGGFFGAGLIQHSGPLGSDQSQCWGLRACAWKP